MKKAVAALLVIAIVLYAVFYTQQDKLPIITGYAAKVACTNIFSAGRSTESVLNTDLDYSLLKYASLDVDETSAQVTASVLGLGPTTARWKQGFGCSIIDGKDDYNIRFPPGNTLSVTYPKKILSEQTDRKIQDLVDRYSDPIHKTRALLVLKGNNILGETYSPDVGASTPLLGWSMTKSIASAIIGTMVADSLLSLDQDHLFAEWADDDRKYITLNHLLTMTSGLAWEEDYTKAGDATEMLFKAEDAVATAIDQGLAHTPGKHWQYSSGTTNLLSHLIRQTINRDKTYWRVAKDRIFKKIYMSSAFIEPDESGTFIMSSFGYATARDWAKFGLLYLNDGVIDGRRILPIGWVDYSKQLVPPSGTKYGAHFWLNTDQATLPDAPADTYWASGYQGQYVLIVPSLDIIVVRLGLSDSWSANAFLKDLTAILNTT